MEPDLNCTMRLLLIMFCFFYYRANVFITSWPSSIIL